MTARPETAAGVALHTWTAVVVVCSLAVSTAVAAVGWSGPAAGAAAAVTVPTISWSACGERLECAEVPVPLDWSHPKGRQINLAATRHLASNPSARIGTMFINPGGPGESGVAMVKDSGDLIDAWGAGRFDVVGWDPRGTNASEPVQCFTSPASEARFWQGAQIPITPAESRAYARRMTELARGCRKVSGDLLPHISTADNARDLDALRQGVGDPSLTYVGLSYGTMLGRTYANLFPTHVRAMMLDSLADQREYVKSAESRTAGSVAGTDPVFEQFLALCQGAGPVNCALAGHPETVKTRVDQLFHAARRAPIPAPHADPPGELSYSDLLLSTFTPMRDPTSWPAYARDLEAGASGDASALETSARAMRSPAGFSKATTSAAIQCADGAAKEPLSAWPKVMKHINETGALWGPVLGWWQWAPCAANWPAGADRYAGPWNAKTKNPLLLISNVYDPATRYYGAQRAERELGNAVLLTVAGYGHPSYQLASKCTDDARVRYLVDLVTPPRGTVCPTDEAPFRLAAQPAAPDTNIDEVPGNS